LAKHTDADGVRPREQVLTAAKAIAGLVPSPVNRSMLADQPLSFAECRKHYRLMSPTGGKVHMTAILAIKRL
jgi:hypothetical protein